MTETQRPVQSLSPPDTVLDGPPARLDRPHVFFSHADETEPSAGARLARRLRTAGISAPHVVASSYGKVLARALSFGTGIEAPPRRIDERWSMDLSARLRARGADALVVVGGGRVLDAGKLTAETAGTAFVAVPTQLSHDGVCSPVAVLPGPDGRTRSNAVSSPRVVLISIPTLLRAPLTSIRAGIGDVLSNRLAVRDWELAATLGLETIDRDAWELALEAVALVEPLVHLDVRDPRRRPRIVTLLANSVIVSGMAMMAAGSSRPASGAEHKLSHAIDAILGPRALHGEQVAFGCVIAAALHGDDPYSWRRQFALLGLPHHPRALRLTPDELVAVLLAAPAMRPRWTVLEKAQLDGAAARGLLHELWPDWAPAPRGRTHRWLGSD